MDISSTHQKMRVRSPGSSKHRLGFLENWLSQNQWRVMSLSHFFGQFHSIIFHIYIYIYIIIYYIPYLCVYIYTIIYYTIIILYIYQLYIHTSCDIPMIFPVFESQFSTKKSAGPPCFFLEFTASSFP